MKKIFTLAIAFTIIAGMAVSCSGNKADGKDDSLRKADSARMADSLAEIEQAVMAVEQARMDSLRQDSIQKAQEEFYNALPDPKKIVWDVNAGKYLKSLGFEGTSKTTSEEEAEGTYTLTMGEKTCKVHYECESNEGDTEITITGDDEALDKYYKRALKMRATYEEGGTIVEKKGNTIKINSFGA